MLLPRCAEACTSFHIRASGLWFARTVCIELSARVLVSAPLVQLTAFLTEMTVLTSSPAFTSFTLSVFNQPSIHDPTTWASAAEWHFLNNRWIQALITLHRVHLGVYLMPAEAEQSSVRTWITQLTSLVYQRSPRRMLNGCFSHDGCLFCCCTELLLSHEETCLFLEEGYDIMCCDTEWVEPTVTVWVWPQIRPV